MFIPTVIAAALLTELRLYTRNNHDIENKSARFPRHWIS